MSICSIESYDTSAIRGIMGLVTIWKPYKQKEIYEPFTTETSKIFFEKLNPFIDLLREHPEQFSAQGQILCNNVIRAYDYITEGKPAGETDQSKNIFHCLDALCDSSDILFSIKSEVHSMALEVLAFELTIASTPFVFEPQITF